MKNKISVCITTFNRAKQLEATLVSISRQSLLPDEVIISDDCSFDSTEETVTKFKKKAPFSVVYSKNERNLNMPGNLNRAIALAQFPYIANLHDADVFHRDLLARWRDTLDRFPNAGFVFCGVGSVDDSQFQTLHSVPEVSNGREFVIRYMLHKPFSIVWGTVMARKCVYEKLLPFRDEYGFISDVDMWFRMGEIADIAYVRQPLILLDHSPTKTRGWIWKHKDAVRRMQYDAIMRLFGDSRTRFAIELMRHKILCIKIILRGIGGGIVRFDGARVYDGFKLAPRFLF